MVPLRHRARFLTALFLCFVGAAGPISPAAADIWGEANASGSTVYYGMSAQELGALPRAPKAGTPGVPPGATYEYTAVVDCSANYPGARTQPTCASAVAACAANPPGAGRGPAVQVWQRTVDGTGRPAGVWTYQGITCLPELVPGNRALTMATVIAAFRDTRFAVPVVRIQPEHEKTLVNLPTFFRVQWPASGFEPGEVDRPDPARMMGYTVEIRPVFRTSTWHFGDGVTTEPVASLGGRWPNGDVRHTYTRRGTVAASVDVTMTGEYRVDGGDWVPIPDTVTIRGTATPIAVVEARAQLVAR